MSNDWILEYRDYSLSLGRKAQQEFYYLEADDISQDLMVFLLEKARLLRDKEPGYVKAAMREQSRRYSEDQRKQHLIISPQYAYRTSHVRKLLENLNYRDKWIDAPVPDEAKSMKGHDGIEMSSDIAWAFSKMQHGSYKDAIITRYADGIVPENGSAESKKLSRAIILLCDILNSYSRPKPGRRAMSNAKAQYILAVQGNGDDPYVDGRGNR